VFGFDDSTSVPERLLPRDGETYCGGAGIWSHDDDDDDEEKEDQSPRPSSPCYRDAAGKEDQADRGARPSSPPCFWRSTSEDRDNAGHNSDSPGLTVQRIVRVV